MTIPSDITADEEEEWLDIDAAADQLNADFAANGEEARAIPVHGPEEETAGQAKFRGIVADADLSDFIKKPKTQVAREYEKKTAAALNSVFKGMVQSPGTVIDAATILVYGDALSAAAGELAQEDEKARGFIDFITTPSNPWVAFLMVAIPFGAQMLRNHEAELAKIKPVQKSFGAIKVGKKRIPFRISFKLGLPRKLKAQTVEPNAMLAVFDHPDVKKTLRKRGIQVAKPKS